MDRHPHPLVDYDEDFVLWAERQVEVLKARDFAALDVEKVIEELEGQVICHKHELAQRLQVTMVHLLKCKHQPERKTRSWHTALMVQRGELAQLLESSPSLRRFVAEFARKRYARARRIAASETRIDESAFPRDLPFTEEQLLDEHFEP